MKIVRRVLILLTFAGYLDTYCQIPDNPHKAPLYWSVYEYHRELELKGESDNYIPEEVFMKNIKMVDSSLKPFGYNMICLDGWGDMDNYNEYGYRSKHSSNWTHDFAWWSDTIQKMGMTMGIYHNPLWINLSAAHSGAMIEGTSIPLSNIVNESEESLWFNWIQIEKPGAKEYIQGNVKYYADMGIKYLRVDFLSWYEDGYDKNYGIVGPIRPQAYYDSALKWMSDACNENNMILSLVMPHLKDEAANEQKYGHMIRINEDVLEGGWKLFNNEHRGVRRDFWSQWANPFDGYTYWSYIAGRNKIILDGDFIRLNSYSNKLEKQTVISLHLLAGGPLSPTDQAGSTMTEENIALYTNSEMLALNTDGFVGRPLTNDPTVDSSQIWTGQLSNGDWIVALFNREDEIINRQFEFSKLGISGNAGIRDLWAHKSLGSMSSIDANIAPHACLVLKVTSDAGTLQNQTITINSINNIDDIQTTSGIKLTGTASSSLDVSYELIYGPATIVNDSVLFTGGTGDILIMAYQNGNDEFAAAVPVPVKFSVTDPKLPYEAFYLIGDATPSGWNIENPVQLQRDRINPYLFAWNGTLTKGELKISTFVGDWCDGDWINASTANQSVSDGSFIITTSCEGPDNKWVLDTNNAGEYNIILDFENSLVEFNKVAPYKHIYLIGDATPSGWDISNPIEMLQDETNPLLFTWTGTLNAGSIKFSTFTGDWCDGDWILANKANQNLSENGYTIYTGCPPENLDNKWYLSEVESGIYTVIVDFESNKVSFFSSTGTIADKKYVSEKYSLCYPNPVRDELTIELFDEELAIVSIYTITGQKIKEFTTEKKITQINIDETNVNGILIVRITTKSFIETHKIISKAI